MIRLHVLGTLELTGDEGRPLLSVLSQPRRLALFAYLALARPAGFHRRDTLVRLFWPEADAEHARDALSQALRFLRRSLGDDAIQGRGAEEVGIARERVWCDVDALESALDAGREEEALELYRGELLEAFNVADAPDFERWLDGERARLRQRVAGAAVTRATRVAEEGNPSGAATWARRAAAFAPFDEALHRQVLQYLDAAGDRAGALQEHESFRRRMEEELESEPAPETTVLVRAIRKRASGSAAGPTPGHESRVRAESAATPADHALDTADSAAPSAAGPRRLFRRATLAALATLVLLGGATAVGWVWRAHRIAAAPAGKRQMIAVLPFQNLGPPEDQYFADGVTDELTTRLSGVKQLGVISRTSANQYRNATKPLKQVGAELGVDYVLEGSVRWARTPKGQDEIRITPQLIRVSDDTHVWADTYDRELREIFAIQSDIARNVADALSVALGTRERRRIDQPPTRSTKAYDLYLRALDRSGSYQESDIRTAIALYQEAVKADPHFVRALLGITLQNTVLVNLGHDRSAEPCRTADAALRRAEALAPDDPEVHSEKAGYYLRCTRDEDRALAEADLAAAGQPSSPRPYATRGMVARRRGQFELSAAELQRAFDLDPRNASRAHELAGSYLMAGRLAEARRYEERATTLDSTLNLHITLADIVLKRTASVDSAKAILRAGIANGPESRQRLERAWIYYDELARDYESALRRIPARPSTGRSRIIPASLLRAELYWLAGRRAEARHSFEEARVILEQWRLKEPAEGRAYAPLAEAYAGLGRRDDALAAAARAVELVPISKNAVTGPEMVYQLARTLTMLGERDAALDRLELLMRYPFTLTPVELRLEPWWDPLRNEPRFQKLAQGR